MKKNNFEDLKVWQKSHKLVLEVYKELNNFPKSEKYILIDQIKRCAISIPSNIVEGHAKNTQKDFIKYLYIYQKGHWKNYDINFY